MFSIFKKVFKKKSAHQTSQQELLRGSAISFVVKISGYGFNYGLAFLISHLYGASGYGIYSIFQSVLQFFTQTGKLGFDTLFMRSTAQSVNTTDKSKLKVLYRKILIFCTILSICLSMILFFSASIIATYYFKKPHLEIYFKIASTCILPIVWMNIFAAYLKGKKKIFAYSFIQQISLLLFTIIFILILSFIINDVIIITLAYLSSAIITLVICYKIFLSNNDFANTEAAPNINFKAETIIAIIFFVSGLMTYLRNGMEALVIGRFYDESFTGIFKAAQKLSSLTSLTLFSTLVIGAPSFANIYRQGDFDKLKAIVQRTTAIVAWTALPIFIFTLLFPEFLLHLFGNDFVIGKDALLIMCIGQFINAIFGPVNNLLMMTNNERLMLYNFIFTNIICAVAGWILIPQYGITGAAYLNLLGNILLNVIPFFIVKKQLGFYSINLKSFLKFR